MALNAAAFRVDKRCGKSGIPDNAKCTKQTSAKSAPSPELKERAFAAATAVQTVRAARSFAIGKKGKAVKQLLSAGKNASEYAQERGERTGNKRLLAFATGKNLVEAAEGARGAARAIKAGDWKSAAFNIGEVGNTALESYTFNRQRQGKKLAAWEEYNRNFGDLLQANKWFEGAKGQAQSAMAPKPSMQFNKQSFKRSLRKQNPLIGAYLRTNAMRRKYEPGYRNNKKPFWTDSFEGELRAGMFRMDKKCGASGIPDNAKCTKPTSAKSAPSPELKEMGKNAPPKRNILQKIVHKVSGKEKLERNLKEIARLKKKYGEHSVEANGGEPLSPNGQTYKWIKKNRPDLDPDKIGANSELAYEISLKIDDAMDLTPAALRADACWKGYVQKGVKRKGNRTVPNCVPVGKAKAEVKSKTGQDGEDKLTSAKRTVWAEGFPAKKTKARR